MYGVLKYIHDHIKENLNLSDISRRFGYSKWHFCVKFREYTGRSFVEYVRHFRLNLAALEILQGAKISDVAMEYGYNGISGFNKAFLTEFGCCPSNYKKHAKDAFCYYERKKMTMFHLNERCEWLRNSVIEINDYEDLFCVQHRVYSSLGQDEGKANKLSNVEIVGEGIVRILQCLKPVIQPFELIVGFNFPDSKYGEYFKPQNTEQDISLMRLNGISDDDIKKYFDFLEGEETKTIRPALVRGGEMMTKGLAQLKYGEKL